jgi:hypothetical protein
MGGNGVDVFENNRIFGGNSSMIYVGNYEIDHENILHCKISVNKYASIPGLVSTLDLDNFNLNVSGRANHVEMVLSGYVVGRITQNNYSCYSAR